MAATSPTSPHGEVDDDNLQPPITGSPPQASVPSPTEDIHNNQQFTSSNSPNSLPQTCISETSAGGQHQPPEDVDDQQEPPVPVPPSPLSHENNLDSQQPLEPAPLSSVLPSSPPPTGAKRSPEKLSPNHESPDSKKPPSPSPPPSVPEHPSESPNHRINRSPGPNPNSDHESPSPSSPAEFQGNPSPKAHQSPKDPSQSPPLTAGSPSSLQDTLEPNTDLAPPLGVPLLLQAVADSSPSKPQISPWTHQETANLIQAYQEKWYSLKKGPLKAGQWEEVAITVAARCGYDEPTKTSKQCRHKIEKLRKRYRAERSKPRSKATAWNFFKLMENLEKGPLPISSSQPMALVEYQKPSNSNGKKRKNDDDGDGEFFVNKRSSRSKKFNHHVINDGLTRNLRFSDGGSRVVRGLRTPVVHKRKGYYKEDNSENEEEEEEEQGGGGNGGEVGLAAQLAAEIKGFAEKFVKMENKKIEMIRDVERHRLEMENTRMKMILESQQMLVETVTKAFSISHKTHKLSAN